MNSEEDRLRATLRSLRMRLDDAERALDTGLSIKHTPTVYRGLQHHRTAVGDDTGAIERALVEAWDKANSKQGTYDITIGPLRRLLQIEVGGEMIAIAPTQRDATVTTALIQWLGTNVGRGLLEEAYKQAGFRLRIEKLEPLAVK